MVEQGASFPHEHSLLAACRWQRRYQAVTIPFLIVLLKMS